MRTHYIVLSLPFHSFPFPSFLFLVSVLSLSYSVLSFYIDNIFKSTMPLLVASEASHSGSSEVQSEAEE